MRRVARPAAALAGLCLAALLLAAPASAGGEVPVCPLAWGVALDGLPIIEARIAAERNLTGLSPRLVVFFLQWPAPGQTQEFPQTSLEAIAASGAVPCLTWEPMHHDAQGREVMAAWGDVLAGAYDAYLADFARRARAWGRPIIVRLGHEMNLARYHWGTDADGYGPESPAIYQRMYRHVVDLCRREGARNLVWAFCPNAESNPHPRWHGAAWNTAGAYYPGPEYVDLLGMDGYNWGLTQTRAKHGWDSRWQEFADIFGELRAELLALDGRKPLVVFETASAGLGGNRDRWVEGAARAARDWGLRALVWFQVDKEVDWRLIRPRDTAAIRSLAPTLCPPGSGLDWLPSPAQAPATERR